MPQSFSNIQTYLEKIKQTVQRWQFGNKAQLAFLEDLYTLIDDGIPANRAIEMMSQSTSGLSQQVAFSLAQKIAEGQPLADGMREWFAANVVEIVRVGEVSGALAESMKSGISMLSQQGAALGSFFAAIIYPILVIIMGCGVIIYINNSAFSQFRLVKPESEWPEAGLRLVAIANFIRRWWWLVFVAIFALYIILKRLMTTYVGELRSFLDQIPPFSFYRRLVAARLLETLGLLISNGLAFRAAIKVMQYQANPYLEHHLSIMEHLLSMGKTNIAEVLETGLINERDLMRLRVMAEVKGLEHGLIRMGIRGAAETTATLKMVSRIVGSALLIVGAMLILVIIQGVYMTGMSMGT